MQIWLDLDDVLADFTGAMCHRHGVSEITQNYAYLHEIIGRRAFYEGVGVEFWENLPVLPHAKELLTLCVCLDPAFRIVTSLPSCVCGNTELDIAAAPGKIKWVLKNFPEHTHRLVMCVHKGVLGHKGTVLIDDNEENCRQFAERDGCALLFPTAANGALGVDVPVDAVALGLESILFRELLG